MKKPTFKAKVWLYALGLLPLVIVGFQNCSGGFAPLESGDSSLGSLLGGVPGGLPPAPQVPVAVPVGGTITDLKIQSTAAVAQSNVPVTLGHVFAPGSLMPTDLIVGKLSDGSILPMQMDVKATHADGSIRHAILSAVLPSLAAGQSQTVLLTKATGARGSSALTPASLVNANFTTSVRVNIGGVYYTASAEDVLRSGVVKEWLAGPVSNEWILRAPFKTASGAVHPHLTARFSVRAYAGQNSGKVDVVIENDWAYEPGPQNIAYDVDVAVGGKLVYSKTGLNHFHHTRWKKTFWWGTAPQVVVRHNANYLINTRAVANYDQSVQISEKLLESFRTRLTDASTEPMKTGLANPAMPTTGGRPDIGLLPSWAAAYILSMDPRAQKATLMMGDMAASWSAHYRDKNTDQPVSLYDYPYMTILGHAGDTVNPATRKQEAFPDCGGVCDNANELDVSHQPNFAYLPYLLSGDFYYLEELQFYATYDSFSSNPGYRQNVRGLLSPEQLRGQGWGLRTIAEAAYITPDQDRLKAHLVGIVNSNMDWYNETYTNNPNANQLGIITNGYSVVYNGGLGTAPWQDDFFTQAIGHIAELGFAKAKPLLAWKAKFQLGRMTAPGFCWIFAASYTLNVRGSETGPFFTNMKDVYDHSLPAAIQPLPCAGAQMASAIELKVGEMGGYSNSNEGYPSNLQPALAYAVDSGAGDGAKAWSVFASNSVKPDYANGPQFAIVPRTK